MEDLFPPDEPNAVPGSAPAAGSDTVSATTPLAERMRPRTLDELLGQEHLLGPGAVLRDMLDSGTLSSSLLLWGRPGSGKTTLARLMAGVLKYEFASFSAVTAGVKDVKAVVERARLRRASGARPLLLFLDEVHRFNKAQQDAFLPHVEDGTLTLVGATTENPSFAINSALLSRSRVFELQPLAADAIETLLHAALSDRERGLGRLNVVPESGVLHQLAIWADGDARSALNALEFAASPARQGKPWSLTSERLRRAMGQRHLGLDRGGEEHYNLISALHKSLRGSDPQASLYWLARLLEAGEDPLYVARRLVRCASEDVGNADPRALTLCVSAAQTVQLIGMPEAELALAQAALYLATAPKSNRVTTAYGAASDDVHERGNPPVPLHLRNAPTRLMRELGRGAGYLYPHDFEAGIVAQDYLPAGWQDRIYYEPSGEGYERTLGERLAAWREFRDGLRRAGRAGVPRTSASPGAAGSDPPDAKSGEAKSGGIDPTG